MAEVIDTALSWLQKQQAPMERLLREMVEISSHTPDLDGVSQNAELYADATRALTGGVLGGGVVPSTSGKYGAHVVMHNAADDQAAVAGARDTVLLVGHHDTVFPKASFSGYREDGELLRGPGVLDMKGGLVVICYALGALHQAGALGRIPVRVVSVGDEEIGSPEGRTLVLEAARGAGCALVFESGRAGDQIVTRRKGIGSMTVTAHGKAAHAGNNHPDGINAIWALARFVIGAQELTDYERGLTINVGKVGGGIGKNTVPDRADAMVDFRFLTAHDGEQLVTALHAAAEAAAAGVKGARIEVHGGISRHPLERTEASAALLGEYAACALKSGLGADEAPLIGGGSDANTVATAGVPAIDGLGPRGKGFHTVEEFIERATLISKAEALVRFLAQRART
ncbi:MAG: Acetylornithine deacetylase/Succinyl-diaminopimelate desuccinylase [Myxococcales bacterium]|nr:Acetylornithine deacetylase/Succinyl-diaminopimelate desuccinylase [Myxococcales bacterium]